jgi:hypothetical protein
LVDGETPNLTDFGKFFFLRERGRGRGRRNSEEKHKKRERIDRQSPHIYNLLISSSL